MSSSLIQALPHAPAPPLRPPTLDALAVTEALEGALRSALASHRRRVRLALLDTCRQQGRVPPAFAAAAAAATAAAAASAGAGMSSSSAGGGGGGGVSEDALAASTAAVAWSAPLEHRLQMALAAYELVRRGAGPAFS